MLHATTSAAIADLGRRFGWTRRQAERRFCRPVPASRPSDPMTAWVMTLRQPGTIIVTTTSTAIWRPAVSTHAAAAAVPARSLEPTRSAQSVESANSLNRATNPTLTLSAVVPARASAVRDERPTVEAPAPLNPYRSASCTGKVIFRSWNLAHERAQRMSRREHERGSGLRFEPYRCRANHIHIGSRDLISNRNPTTRRGRPRIDDEE